MDAAPRFRKIPAGAWWTTLVVVLLATGCISGRNDTGDTSSSSPPTNSPSTTPTTASGGEFILEIVESPMVCDGSGTVAVRILGAQPFEQIEITPTGPSNPLRPDQFPLGIADDDGDYILSWRCAREEAGTTWDFVAVGQGSGRTATFSIESVGANPAGLTVSGLVDPFRCDTGRRPVASLSGAIPGEIIDFTSTDAAKMAPGVADETGKLDVNWRCDASQGDKKWTITATGQTSNSTVEFSFSGSIGASSELAADFVENPFVCDSGSRPLADLTGLAYSEFVDFSSPQTDNMREGQADSSGQLTIRWQCSAVDVGTTWTVTVTGRSSGRSTTLTFTGAAPETAAPDLELEMSENPFVCDGGTRGFAVISNFVSREFVDFTSPQTENLSQGQADGEGRLPLRWQCVADDVGDTWEITATGRTSGLTITFTLDSAAASADS